MARIRDCDKAARAGFTKESRALHCKRKNGRREIALGDIAADPFWGLAIGAAI
jgi:hypothetical protein